MRGHDRDPLNELFATLCRAESPSGRESACAAVVRAELGRLGLEAREDDAAGAAGADCGNLLARLPGPGPGVLLCAHLDTVPALAPIEPVLEDGVWSNANAAILGADNKAALAVILAVARRCRERGAPQALELLFTVGEERSLAGARAFDVGRLQSAFGYVLDHATPIGDVVTAAPSLYRIEATFHGAAAHAGIRPEEGRSALQAAARAVAAMELGRLDDHTTANVGVLRAGSAANVVPERAVLEAEARSLDDGRAAQVAAVMIDHIHDAANLPACECDVDVTLERLFGGYRVPPASAALAVAREALLDAGHPPRPIATGGGSDANALRAQGFDCVNLANGTERAHEPGERVSADALREMLEVVWGLLQGAARRAGGELDEGSPGMG